MSKIFIYRIIAAHAGKANSFSQNTAHYPARSANPKNAPKIAQLASALGIEFSELAYIKRKGSAKYTLKNFVSALEWLENRAELYPLLE